VVGGYGNPTSAFTDDGIAEIYWLIYEPQEGEVAPGEEASSP
jgi:hypothetical protein